MCVALGFACFSPIFESHDNLVMKTQPWVLKDLGSICHQVLVRLQASYFILLFSVPQTLTNTTLLLHLTPPFLALSISSSYLKLWTWPATFHLLVLVHEGHRFHLTIQSTIRIETIKIDLFQKDQYFTYIYIWGGVAT